MQGLSSRGAIRRLAASGLAAALLIVGLPLSASGQRALLDALTPGSGESREAAEEAGSAEPLDPLDEIERALAAARAQRQTLEQARTDSSEPDSVDVPGIELADRIVRVLEQRREAQIRTRELGAGRQAIEAALARDPSELFGMPPPFPVPILDNVRQSWRRELEQEAQQRGVLEDRRANLRLAQEEAEDLDRQRRRLRERLARTDEELERIRLETQLRELDDRIVLARQQATLAEQRVTNAAVEYEIKEIAQRQARAALAWVEAHVAPRESDLADAIERLDRERFDLDRELDLLRSDLAAAEQALRAVETRRDRAALSEAGQVPELEVRRAQLGHRQHRLALLNQRLERLGRMRTTWRQRYVVLGGQLELAQAPDWRDSAAKALERLTRERRIQEAELAERRLELAGLLRALSESTGRGREARHWHELELQDLEALVTTVQADLASLDAAIGLEERHRAELSARLEARDLGERMRGLGDRLRAFWSYEITASQDSPITPGKLLLALFVFTVGYLTARFLTRLAAKRLFPRLGFDSGASNAFAALTFYGLLAASFLFALRAVHIPLTAFAVVGGALALGVGFGSQAVVSNFISGLLLLAERPIRIGDLIEVSGVVGTVEAIGLRSTRIRTPDNFHIIVPNASFLESNVVNWTHQDPNIRLRVVVGVAYGSPTREVERLLLETASEHPRCLPHPAPMVIFRDFADSALVFELRFWIRYDQRTDRSAIQSEVRFRIDELFAAQGITIAFPQLDVHLDMKPTSKGES
jgi:small-conductance mechanosensitive channel